MNLPILSRPIRHLFLPGVFSILCAVLPAVTIADELECGSDIIVIELLAPKIDAPTTEEPYAWGTHDSAAPILVAAKPEASTLKLNSSVTVVETPTATPAEVSVEQTVEPFASVAPFLEDSLARVEKFQEWWREAMANAEAAQASDDDSNLTSENEIGIEDQLHAIASEEPIDADTVETIDPIAVAEGVDEIHRNDDATEESAKSGQADEVAAVESADEVGDPVGLALEEIGSVGKANDLSGVENKAADEVAIQIKVDSEIIGRIAELVPVVIEVLDHTTPDEKSADREVFGDVAELETVDVEVLHKTDEPFEVEVDELAETRAGDAGAVDTAVADDLEIKTPHDVSQNQTDDADQVAAPKQNQIAIADETTEKTSQQEAMIDEVAEQSGEALDQLEQQPLAVEVMDAFAGLQPTDRDNLEDVTSEPKHFDSEVVDQLVKQQPIDPEVHSTIVLKSSQDSEGSDDVAEFQDDDQTAKAITAKEPVTVDVYESYAEIRPADSGLLEDVAQPALAEEQSLDDSSQQPPHAEAIDELVERQPDTTGTADESLEKQAEEAESFDEVAEQPSQDAVILDEIAEQSSEESESLDEVAEQPLAESGAADELTEQLQQTEIPSDGVEEQESIEVATEGVGQQESIEVDQLAGQPSSETASEQVDAAAEQERLVSEPVEELTPREIENQRRFGPSVLIKATEPEEEDARQSKSNVAPPNVAPPNVAPPNPLVGGSPIIAKIDDAYLPYDLSADDLRLWSVFPISTDPLCVRTHFYDFDQAQASRLGNVAVVPQADVARGEAVVARGDLVTANEAVAAAGSPDCLMGELVWKVEQWTGAASPIWAKLTPNEIGHQLTVLVAPKNRIASEAAHLLATSWKKAGADRQASPVGQALLARAGAIASDVEPDLTPTDVEIDVDEFLDPQIRIAETPENESQQETRVR